MSAAEVDTVTVLHVRKPDGIATKTHRWEADRNAWRSQDYDAGMAFEAETHSVSDIHELGALVIRLRSDPRKLVIRGDLKPEFVGKPVRRKKTGDDAPFVEKPRHWLMADVDNFAFPEGLDLNEDIITIIERAITALLPEAFHDCVAFWQLSASSGVKPGLRVHLWFWLDRPISSDDLREWMKLNARGIDMALFNTVQIHYTADPVIIGAPDPIRQRTGWIEGSRDCVTLPEIDTASMRRARHAQGAKNAAAAGFSSSQAATIDGALAELGDGEGLSGFNAPLLRASWLYALRTKAAERDARGLKDRLRAAISAAPRNLERDLSAYGDPYLDRIITGAFLKAPLSAGWESCPPEYELPTLPADAARTALEGAMAGFMAQPHRHALFGPEPRRGLVVATVGLGKTERALRQARVFIAREKAAGRPHRVAMFVPEHALGLEVARRAGEVGIKFATWRGRSYIDPTGTTMCDDIEAVDLAAEAGLSAGSAACGSPDAEDGKVCPFFGSCRYQAQRAAAVDADLVIAAHALAFRSLPSELSQDLGLVLIDEAFWAAGLRSRKIRLPTFAADAIAHPVLKTDGYGRQVTDELRTNDLQILRGRIIKALEASPNGYLTRKAAVAAGVTPEDCKTARQLEWLRKRDVKMFPGMSRELRKREAKEGAVNRQIPRMAALWKEVGGLLDGEAEATGRISLGVDRTDEGDCPVAWINERQDLCDAVLGVPVLAMDATADIEIVRHYLPGIEMLADARAIAPHMAIHQIIGPLSKTSLASRADVVAELVDFARAKAGEDPALVVCNLEFEEKFRGIPNVSVAHFGAVNGRDEWKNVRHLFVIGGTTPSPEETSAMAARLTGKPVVTEQPKRTEIGILMRDGSGIATAARRYADPQLEMIREAVADSAIEQAVGRGRGVNRGAGEPLDVWLMGNFALAQPADEVAKWEDVALDTVERMAARGLVLLSATDAFAFYPDLFPSSEAARKAITRFEKSRPLSDFPDIPLYITLYKEMSGKYPSKVIYRPEGRGQQGRTAYVSSSRLAGLRDFLEEKLGPLALFEIVPADRAAQGHPGDGGDIPEVAEAPAPEDIAAAANHAADEAAGAEFDRLFTTTSAAPAIVNWGDQIDADVIAAGMYARARGEPVRRPAIRLPQLHVGRMDRGETARLQEQVWARVERGEGSALAAQLVAFVGEHLVRAAA